MALAVVAALALAGCAGAAEPGATPSAATTAEMSAAPDPSATPTTGATTGAATAGTNSIAAPADGSTVTGPQVEVTGAGTAFEATLRWRVLKAGSTDVVTEDFTNAGANGDVGPYAFTVELTPGGYTLEVWEPGMSEADTEPETRANLVTSTFTVT